MNRLYDICLTHLMYVDYNIDNRGPRRLKIHLPTFPQRLLIFSDNFESVSPSNSSNRVVIDEYPKQHTVEIKLCASRT